MIFTLSDGKDYDLGSNNAFGVLGRTGLDITYDGDNRATIDFTGVGEHGMRSADVSLYLDKLRGGGMSASQTGSVIEVTGNLPHMNHLAAMVNGRAVELMAGGGDPLGRAFEDTVRTIHKDLHPPEQGARAGLLPTGPQTL